MDKLREQIYLAGLLHDIGKFYQRADKPFSDKASELSNYSKTLAEDICPINDKGRFGYQHVVWTNQFLEDIKEVLNKIPELKTNLYENWSAEDSLANFACNHHKPKTELQAIVTMADWWSAGIDRRENVEKEELNDKINWGKERYKKIPLYSIFNTIHQKDYQSAFPLKSLCIEDFSKPKLINNVADGISENDYYKLWIDFLKQVKELPTDSIQAFTDSLLFLLKKFTWCIPSNTMDMENVSLFEHLKTTAAFVVCLYAYKEDNKKDFSWNGSTNRLTIKEDVYPVLLLGVDISGIQKFIYNIASRKAAVSLKGRSFYLQLVIDSIIQRIVLHPDIKAKLGNVIYSSGGKFYMLLPNTEKVKKAIEELRIEFEKTIFEEHFGQLIINMDFVGFAYKTNDKTISIENEDNNTANLGDLWKFLADKLTAKKNKKFKNLITTDFDKFFEVNKVVEKSKVCAVTGIESNNCVILDTNEKDDSEKTYVLPSVKKQADLGNTLKDADYVITYKSVDESKYLSNRAKFHICVLGIHTYLFDRKELIIDDADFRRITSADVTNVKWINKTNFLAAKIKGNEVSYGFQFYGGNKQAITNKGNNKTFEELSNESYFGVLRMDVDGLGEIFIKGLPEKDKTFAAYATLSFLLDYFFSGILNTIRGKGEFKDFVNIIYSGGDDVFAVGRWDKLINFAAEIRREFKNFVGRDDITISGGIAIVGNKFPIAKAAELAGIAEHKAKKFKNGENNLEKNAINIFGENISWNKEFEFVKSYKLQFLDLINNENMSRSILHKIMQFNDMKKRKDLSYIWNTAYFLKRFKDKEKNEKVIKFLKEKLESELLKLNNSRNYELIALAARWAELELKENY